MLSEVPSKASAKGEKSLQLRDEVGTAPYIKSVMNTVPRNSVDTALGCCEQVSRVRCADSLSENARRL